MELHNVKETAALAGVSVQCLIYHRNLGFIPDPSFTEGCRKLYTDAEVKLICDHFKKPLTDMRRLADFYTVREAANYLGISYPAITKRIEIGSISPPSHRPKGRARYYKKAELDAMKAHLKEATPTRSKIATASGFYSVVQAANRLKMPVVTLQTWIKKKLIPRPRHKLKGIFMSYYKDEDLTAIRKARNDYFIKRIKLL